MRRVRNRGKKLTYWLGCADIFGAMDIDNFWTELFACVGARRRGLSESIGIL